MLDHVKPSSTMMRNKVLTAIQKTYDDSYLSCSTAVYYESQGDEREARRHWKAALDQIYEYHATKAPAAYIPQTDTERSLYEAVRSLELQCKERIDLLEALRESRLGDPAALNGVAGSSKPPLAPARPNIKKGSIGQGSVPAVTYSELSRPRLPPRPSLPGRSSSERAVVDESVTAGDLNDGLDSERTCSIKSSSRLAAPELTPTGSGEKASRSNSPEKHTMRTTLRSGKSGEKPSKVSRKPHRGAGEGPSKAATLAWTTRSSRERQNTGTVPDLGGIAALAKPQSPSEQSKTPTATHWDSHSRRLVQTRDPNTSSGPVRHSDELPMSRPSLLSVSAASSVLTSSSYQDLQAEPASAPRDQSPAPRPPPSSRTVPESAKDNRTRNSSSSAANYASNTPIRRRAHEGPSSKKQPVRRSVGPSNPSPRNPRSSGGQTDPPFIHRKRTPEPTSTSSDGDEGVPSAPRPRERKKREQAPMAIRATASSPAESSTDEEADDKQWEKRKKAILKNLPQGVDEAAAKQILNDIIVKGDEVRWDDIAGLDIAKNALRETVVYPFLRPDLFMGLREPARGMLLFGPPGTGKTMLARAVATESRSTFFSISASSLTSKFLGESEKLVRALFGLAKTLAPSIIFVDEIDSLLSQRSGSGEHEATRRIKTEFLIQWSDLQRAAAGRETTERDRERGDANQVLVLAATNLPWAIDEAARRRFVRRQYIPLPEQQTRETQLRTLLGQQKHGLTNDEIQQLVNLTDGFSGSDITALAKDAAMGPLRSLGEALLHMTMDQIRPIMLVDFQASLSTIRPSVGKAGLKEYEDWAREFGERGG